MADPATSALLLKAAPYAFNRTSLELKLNKLHFHYKEIPLLIAPVWN